MRTKLLFAFMIFSIPVFGQQNPIQIDANGLTQTLTAGGVVTRGQIVKINSAGQVVPVLTTDTSGAIGIAATSQTSQGNSVTVSIAGTLLVQIDSGGCVAGNIVSISTITGGAGHCASTAVGQQIGVAQSISSPGSNFWNVIISFAGSGGIPPNTPLPASSSGPGPVFNVKNYGAKGDTQESLLGSFGSGSNIVTCTNCHFQNGKTKVGMSVWGNRNNTGSIFTLLAQSTITSIDSDTQIHVSNNAAVSEVGFIVWGDIDDTPVNTALTAALAQSVYISNQGGLLGQATASPVLFFPAGGYLFCNPPSGIAISVGNNLNGLEISGSGISQSILFFGGSGCTTPNNSTLGAVINIASGVQNAIVHGLTVNGGLGSGLQQASAISISGRTHIWDTSVESWGIGVGAGFFFGSGIVAENITATGNSVTGIQCNSCSGEIYSMGSSNNGSAANVLVANVTGVNGGGALRFYGGLVDECGSNTTGCTQVTNSHDVWFNSTLLFGTSSGHCLSIDGNSLVHAVGGVCGSFGNDTNNGGPIINTGGVLQASDFRMHSTGTGKCATVNGTLNDNGGNTCESQFVIASGTSTGTTAVLTLTTLGANVNTNCSVGDALVVQGAGLAGYDGYYAAGATTGITAVTATTLTYTTVASNIGALGAGGTALCRNLQTYSGNLPRALLNNPIPNTCYITGTFAATTTAAPMCAFKLGSATNVSQIKATSTTTTACTVAPVVTISDGTVSETLTITTAKSIWDSSVDASTGVGTSIFKPNGTITLSNTAGTCTTPPTNFSVSYNISPILSN